MTQQFSSASSSVLRALISDSVVRRILALASATSSPSSMDVCCVVVHVVVKMEECEDVAVLKRVAARGGDKVSAGITIRVRTRLFAFAAGAIEG